MKNNGSYSIAITKIRATGATATPATSSGSIAVKLSTVRITIPKTVKDS